MRKMMMLALAVALAGCESKPDAAHQAMEIRQGFEQRLRSALRGTGEIEETIGNTVKLHAIEDGCSKIYGELRNTKAPVGIVITCGNLVKGDQWRLWSNEISVLEAR